MSDHEPLNLVVLYDRNQNEYSILAHNQSAVEAEALTEQQRPTLTNGSSLITLSQSKRHGTADAQACRACRETVARSSGLEPQPKFCRRKP